MQMHLLTQAEAPAEHHTQISGLRIQIAADDCMSCDIHIEQCHRSCRRC